MDVEAFNQANYVVNFFYPVSIFKNIVKLVTNESILSTEEQENVWI